MDVRAKQRLSYQTFLVNSELRVIGFAPRHLNRSAAFRDMRNKLVEIDIMKILHKFVNILGIILFGTIVCLSQANNSFHIEPINDDAVPVSIDSSMTYENYDAEESFYTTDFSLTNKSESYIGIIRLIGYELDENNEELSTRFWSEEVSLKPFETKHLSTNSGSVSSETVKSVWVVHTVCSEAGTSSIDLSDLRKTIFPYRSGKNITLPKAAFNQNKCLPD